MKTSLLTFWKNIRSQSAESLAEVIIAMTILTLGTGSASILVTTAVRATASGENRLVAYNLAREGVESVRSIRDTNWLRFPGDRTNCWDVINVTDISICASTPNKLGSALGVDYAIDPDMTTPNELFKWNVISSPPPKRQKIYLSDLNGASPGGEFYTHNTSDPATMYSRVINVVKTPGQMDVTATVSWEEHDRPVTISFMDRLINY
jgi:hypothetical protein